MRYSAFFDRIKEYAKFQNKTIEAVVSDATNGKISKDVYQGWRRRETLPSGEFCYDIAQSMGVTTDWLISGQDKSPLLIKYADVISNLEEMDLQTLENARIMLASLAENCKKKGNRKKTVS